MLKQSLQQRLLQKLSPQQIQLMKLLQVPTAELETRVKEELEVNPALQEKKEDRDDRNDELSKLDQEDNRSKEETSEDIDLSDYLSDDDYGAPSYKERGYSGSNSDDENKVIPIEMHKSFHEYLLDQLGMLRLNDRDHDIAEQIVGSIGDDGYLRRDERSIVNDLAFSQNLTVTEEEIQKLLKRIQQFEPAGIGARSLQECLSLQLRRNDEEKMEDSEKLALEIIDNHFDAFSKKHFTKLEQRLDIERDELKEAIDEILKLNPKPASGYSSGGDRIKQYIVPDFMIENLDGKLKLSLNSRNAPELQINRDFMNMMKSYKESKTKTTKQKEAVLFIKRKLDSAKWFIEAIKQRQQTLIGTMSTILEYQKDFFLTGDEMELRPMILKDIAEVTGLDISTVSRVANSKYVQTEFGTYPLKYFFSESLQTDDGEEASTREVKRVLQNIIDGENKRKPLSDQKLMEQLQEKGYNIARRTVAKYREQLNIPVARLRKEL